jgi:hypothetical protein
VLSGGVDVTLLPLGKGDPAWEYLGPKIGARWDPFLLSVVGCRLSLSVVGCRCRLSVVGCRCR